jgi:hypothetical protein
MITLRGSKDLAWIASRGQLTSLAHPVAKENDRSVRKADARSMRRPTLSQARTRPDDKKDENLHDDQDIGPSGARRCR